jgi:hypothetical protein
MGEWLAKIKLGLLLRLTPYLVRRAAFWSPRTQQLLGEDSFVLEVRTCGGAGGHFVLDNGCCRFASGIHPKPDFEILLRGNQSERDREVRLAGAARTSVIMPGSGI